MPVKQLDFVNYLIEINWSDLALKQRLKFYKLKNMNKIKLISITLLFIPMAAFAQLKNQLNLDDVEIKGEAQGSKGLGISNRKKNDLSGRIKLKSNFLPDILEELPENFKLPTNFTLISDPR